MVIECPQCHSRYESTEARNQKLIYCQCGVSIQIPDLPNIAKSWSCPNCAGDVNPNQTRCEYCTAYIAFARCPSCFSIAPYNDAKFCAECGIELTLPIKPIIKNKKILPCPRCDHYLTSNVIEDYLVDYCLECNGVWLSHQLLDSLLKDLPRNSTAALGQNPAKGIKQLYKHKVRYLRCPECDDTMSRHNFMRDSNIIIDQCGKHGIWFDKHELAVALDYVRSSRDKPNIKKPAKKMDDQITRRPSDEVFDISSEDLVSLIQEFPQLFIP